MEVFKSKRYIMPGHDYRYYGRGNGLGNLFTSLYSAVVPMVKRAIGVGARALASPAGRALRKEAKRTAMKAGLDVVGSVLQGERPAKAAKREIAKASRTMGEAIQRVSQGQSLGRRRSPRKKKYGAKRRGGGKRKKNKKKKKGKRGAKKGKRTKGGKRSHAKKKRHLLLKCTIKRKRAGKRGSKKRCPRGRRVSDLFS